MTETTLQTILIVDDSPDNLSVLGELLHPAYRVRVANSGKRALDLAATPPHPDLIPLDVMMPGMDGYQVFKRLRAAPATCDMALADVFDALITQRVYKKAMSYKEARGIIMAGRGKHFDPDMVDAFLAVFSNFCAIADRHRDPALEAPP